MHLFSSLSRLLSVLLMVLCFVPSLKGQAGLVRFEQFSPENGLYENSMWMSQDRKGYLWLATNNGVVRYDGHRYKNWRNDPEDPHSLPSNELRCLEEGPDGALWIGTSFSGLVRMDPTTEQFATVGAKSASNTGLAGELAYFLYVDPTGLVWTGGDAGVDLVQYDQKATHEAFTVRHLKVAGESEAEAKKIYQIVPDDGAVWICTDDGLIYVSTADVASIHAGNDGSIAAPQRFLKGMDVLAVAIDANGTVWVARTDGIHVLAKAGGVYQVQRRFVHDPTRPEGLPVSLVRALHFDAAGNLWIGTNGSGVSVLRQGAQESLLRMENAPLTLQHIRSDPADLHGLDDNQIRYIKSDGQGNVWIGSHRGLNRYHPLQDQLGHRKSILKAGYFMENDYFCCYQDGTGKLWAGARKGLSEFAPEGELRKIHFPGDPQSKSNYENAVRAILPFEGNSLLLATLNGLTLLDTLTGQFRSYDKLPIEMHEAMGSRLFHLARDRKGRIWIAGLNGLFWSDPLTGEYGHFVPKKGNPASISHIYVRFIHIGPKGNIWLATEKGVDVLREDDPAIAGFGNPPEGQEANFKHYRNSVGNPNSLSNDQVRALTHGADGALWIGTDGGGINRLDPNTGACTRYTTQDGLTNDVVYGLLADQQGAIWASTSYGISRFDPATKAFRNFTTENGLQDNEFNIRAANIGPQGEVFFGGPFGLNRFFPDQIRKNEEAPAVAFTGFLLANQQVDFSKSSLLDRPVDQVEAIRLKHSDDIFSLEFSALDFTATRRNQYAYRMKGFRDEWIEVGNDHKVTFTGLDPGSYVFEVKASNSDGVWNETPRAMRIVIDPPIWATWWAKTLYLLLALGLIYFFYRIRMNRLRIQNQLEMEQMQSEKLQEVEQLKSRFFAGISHEFRTPLSLIIGPMERLKAQSPDRAMREHLDMISSNAERLLRLVNQLLDIARLEEGALHMNRERRDMVLFIQQIGQSFGPAAREQRIQLELDCPKQSMMMAFDAEKFEHVLFNLLANALRYTPSGGTISIGLRAVEKGIEIRVSDTGTGIPESHLPHIFDRFYQVDRSKTSAGTGLGLSLVKEIVELHGGAISVASGLGEGTVFLMHFPEVEIIENADREVAGTIPEIKEAPKNTIEPRLEEVAAIPETRDAPIILLAEDNADLRKFIRGELEGKYIVIEASDGQQGWELAQEHIPDLIVSDVMMPHKDGFELSYLVKSTEATSHIPVMLLTARNAEESRIEGFEVGADDYLAKPFSPRELMLRIRNRLEWRDRLMQRFGKPEVEVADKEIDKENAFISKVTEMIGQRLDDSEMSVEDLATALGLGRKQLYRKIKALSGKTPSQYIRAFRLGRGKRMLLDSSLTISEVAYAVGFSSPSYFSRCFQEEFGQSPSDFRPGD